MAIASLGGSVRISGKGGYHPGAGPIDRDGGITWSSGAPLVTPYEGLQLYITTYGNVWTTITNFPAYLLGNNCLMTTTINESDTATATLLNPCRIYLIRDTGWNAVDITGWTLQESSRAMTMSTVSIYYKDFAAGGPYTLDNNSAMYVFVFPNPVSAPTGSIGKSALKGVGDTIANTSATPAAAYRQTLDPFNMGTVTYSLASGSLPPGYTLNTSTGLVSGSYTPSAINTDGQVYTFVIRSTDASRGATNTSDRSYTITLSVPWLYRQIITTAYMAGGYQNGVLWSNVNKFPRSTETPSNLGDNLIDNYHYKSGMCDTNRGHIFNGNTTTTFSMRTDTKVNGVGAPGYTCANTGTTFSPDRNRSFTIGEGVSNCFKFTASSNTFTTLGSGQGGHAAGVSGENKGIWWGDANRSINFTTEGQATITMAGGAHGQQKGLSAKTGFGYGGNEGTYAGGYNFRKINITNESYSTIGKMAVNCGEENYAMTQDRGYMLGEYNDTIGQNNICGRLIYSTDAAATLAVTVVGHGGASSGHCFWRD